MGNPNTNVHFMHGKQNRHYCPGIGRERERECAAFEMATAALGGCGAGGAGGAGGDGGSGGDGGGDNDDDLDRVHEKRLRVQKYLR